MQIKCYSLSSAQSQATACRLHRYCKLTDPNGSFVTRSIVLLSHANCALTLTAVVRSAAAAAAAAAAADDDDDDDVDELIADKGEGAWW
jgi:hypothetical protein